LSFCRLRWIVVSCRIASVFNATSRNLGMYLSVDSLRWLPQCRFFYLHFRNVFRNLFQDVCLENTIHRIWGCVLAQLSMKIANDITSLWSDVYSRYPSRKALLYHGSNVGSSSHEYSCDMRLLEHFMMRIKKLDTT